MQKRKRKQACCIHNASLKTTKISLHETEMVSIKVYISSDIYQCIYRESENKTAYLSVRTFHQKNINKLRQ